MALRKEHKAQVVSLDKPNLTAEGIGRLGFSRNSAFLKVLPGGDHWGTIYQALRRDRVYPIDPMVWGWHMHTRQASMSMIREFMQLSLMHSAIPENAVRPIALATYNSRIVGYFSEYVDGTTVRRGIALRPDKKEEVTNKVVEVVRRFHAKGIGHGDLVYLCNVFLAEDGRILLYDPFRPLMANNRFLINVDRASIRNDFRYMSEFQWNTAGRTGIG